MEASGGDDTLVTEVEELLRHDAEANDSLFVSLDEQASDVFAAKPRRETIGRYRVVRELGQGGMGTVYLARRDDDEYDMEVAIKLVPAVLDRDELMRRFRAERQIMASLEHPNIARLLDGDTTRDGVPYVIMEYVQGVPIDVYCRDNALGIDERLALFRQVCSAVSHAHRNLVIHRDIKPGNILVTKEGVPKLLDFGIAKILDTDGPMAASLTRSSMRMMTPEYASPEQVRGEAITTTSDVYSLGVLLHKLLTDELPYALDTRELGAVERVICEQPPTRPTQLAPDVSKELDDIVLMALRKEPERRYPSVDAFADDLRRFLDGLPVTARADTASYRIRKFVTRHALAVGASAAVFIVLAGLGVGMTYQAITIATERDRAEQSLRKADDSLEFLVSLFRDAAPKVRRGESFTALDLLDRGRGRINNELTEHPLSQALLMSILGEVYYELGDYEVALELHTAALQRYEQVPGASPQELRNTLLELSRTNLKLGRNDDAEVHTLRAIDVQDTYMLDEEPNRVLPLQMICDTRYATGDYAEALPYCLRTVEIARLPTTTRPETLSSALNGLANVYVGLGEYGNALDYYIESQQVDIESLGPDHPWTAISTSNIGYAYRRLRQYDDAQRYYVDSLAIAEKVWPATHPEIRRIKSSIGLVYRLTGRYDEAEAFLLPIAAEYEATGETGAWAYYDLAILYDVSGQHAKMLDASQRYFAYARSQEDESLALEARDLGIHALIGMNRLDAADEALAELLPPDINPESLPAEYGCLIALKGYLTGLREPDSSATENYFDLALAVEGGHEQSIRLLLARSLALRDEAEGARVEMQRAVELGFEDPISVYPELATL